MRLRPAFTLIEMLIAISLGMAICYTAFFAVRVAGQVISQTNRLSTENELMRAGISGAFNELDFWQQFDDQDPATGPLSADGQPFHQLDFSGAGLDLDFNQTRPETLWRGCGAAHDGALFYGQYQLYGNIAHPDPVRRWHANFLKGMAEHLGYYALIDYAPANTIYSYMQEDGTVPARFRDSPNAETPFYANHFPDHGPCDMHRLTHAGGYAISTTWPCSQQGFSLWNPGSEDPLPGWDFKGMYDHSAEPVPLLPMKPEHWPDIKLDIRHFVASYRSWHTASIHVTSPLTGKVFKLFMSATATTLRGARRQRGLDGGVP